MKTQLNSFWKKNCSGYRYYLEYYYYYYYYLCRLKYVTNVRVFVEYPTDKWWPRTHHCENGISEMILWMRICWKMDWCKYGRFIRLYDVRDASVKRRDVRQLTKDILAHISIIGQFRRFLRKFLEQNYCYWNIKDHPEYLAHVYRIKAARLLEIITVTVILVFTILELNSQTCLVASFPFRLIHNQVFAWQTDSLQFLHGSHNMEWQPQLLPSNCVLRRTPFSQVCWMLLQCEATQSHFNAVLDQYSKTSIYT